MLLLQAVAHLSVPLEADRAVAVAIPAAKIQELAADFLCNFLPFVAVIGIILTRFLGNFCQRGRVQMGSARWRSELDLRGRQAGANQDGPRLPLRKRRRITSFRNRGGQLLRAQE